MAAKYAIPPSYLIACCEGSVNSIIQMFVDVQGQSLEQG